MFLKIKTARNGGLLLFQEGDNFNFEKLLAFSNFAGYFSKIILGITNENKTNSFRFKLGR